MKVDITNGYVILRDFYTRKTQRDWESICMKGKTFPYRDGDNVSIPVTEFRLAQEGFVLNMVLSAWKNTDAGPEQIDMTNPQAWLDELPEQDYEKILDEAENIKGKKESDAKKS